MENMESSSIRINVDAKALLARCQAMEMLVLASEQPTQGDTARRAFEVYLEHLRSFAPSGSSEAHAGGR